MSRRGTPADAGRAWWSVLIVVIAAVAVAVAGVAYTGYAQRRADQRWCDLLATLDQPAEPPTTQRGREIQREVHDLLRDLDCGSR
ncbi:MAG TPA: hypothetical protein VF174_11840 [Micromonosporaceae bacterium]